MHRLLVKVRKKTLKKRYRDRHGLEYARYALRVRVMGSAIDALKVPKRHIGRDTTVSRDFLLPWVAKVGDLLVLDPSESARVLCPRRPPGLGRLSRTGAPGVESADVDRDGFSEDLLTNAFVRAVVQPHRGARVQSLRDYGGIDRFAQPFDYIMAGKQILLGGAEESIAEAGSPGDMWKAAFRRREPIESTDAVEIGYWHELKSPEGVSFSKRVRVERDLPGVVQRYEVAYSGKRKPEGGRGDGDGSGGSAGGPDGQSDEGPLKEDKADVTLCVRITTPTHGEIASRNVFDVPGASGITLVRYHRPGYGRRWRWRDWRDEHFGLRAGFLVSRHEEIGAVLAILFSPRATAHVSIRRDFQGPELTVRHVRKKLAKGKKCRYGLAFLIGHAVATASDSMLLVTKGEAGPGGVPVAITLRTQKRVDRVRASVSTPGGRTSATLSRHDLLRAGCVYTKTVRFPKAAFPLSCSVRVGGERLSVDLEA